MLIQFNAQAGTEGQEWVIILKIIGISEVANLTQSMLPTSKTYITFRKKN